VDSDIKDLKDEVVYLDSMKNGQGLKGLWMGFIAGLTHQIVLYLIIILNEPWCFAI